MAHALFAFTHGEGSKLDPEVRSVSRALALLRCFTYNTPELTLAELSEQSGLSKSTALRLLHTLEAQGFVTSDNSGGRYQLGPALIELGAIALHNLDLHRVARPLLETLCDRTQETVNLSVLSGDQVLYIATLDSPQPVRIAARPGRRLPVHCTATGRVFLAFGSEVDTERILKSDLKAYTPYTKTDPEELRRAIQETRERGFAIAEQEFELGITAVGAPIWGVNGRLVGAIGVAGPSYRIPFEKALQIGEAAREVACTISRQLGAPLNLCTYPRREEEASGGVAIRGWLM